MRQFQRSRVPLSDHEVQCLNRLFAQPVSLLIDTISEPGLDHGNILSVSLGLHQEKLGELWWQVSHVGGLDCEPWPRKFEDGFVPTPVHCPSCGVLIEAGGDLYELLIKTQDPVEFV